MKAFLQVEHQEVLSSLFNAVFKQVMESKPLKDFTAK